MEHEKIWIPNYDSLLFRDMSKFLSSTPLTHKLLGHSEESKKADAFFSAAQKRMGTLLSNSGVIEAQCFFLAGVYLMATIQPIEAWRMFVQALACCQGFDTRSSDEEERQLQESIHWTCFRSELYEFLHFTIDMPHANNRPENFA